MGDSHTEDQREASFRRSKVEMEEENCQKVAKTFTTQMLPPPPPPPKKKPNKKNNRIKPKQAGGESLGPEGGEGCAGDQRVGKVGEERSGWVSHIHTLGVETGY